MVRESGFGRRRASWLSPIVVVVTLGGGFLALGGQAEANVTAVDGGAYGFFSNVSLFGSPFMPQGPAPKVTLPHGGSATAVTAGAPSERAQYGPATIFSSGRERVSTRGRPGATGQASSTTFLEKVKGGPFTADEVSSSCKATQAAVIGTTSIVNGQLVTSTDANGNPVTTVAVPPTPPPDTTFTGTVTINGSVDHWKYVFNEQVVNPDGSLTVRAGHEYLLGPTAKGNLIFGRATCGVTAPAA